MILFGNIVFVNVIKMQIKIGSSWNRGDPYSNTMGVLIKRDTEIDTQRENHVKIPQEDSHLQAKERGFRKNLTDILISDF